MKMSYWRFAAMIATSTVVMFGLMYLNTYVLEHVLWSETRFWMAFVMGAAMAVIMLSYMQNMYKSKGINIAIYAGSVAVFAGALWLVRSQVTISGVDYMQAMVPHHSIAILTSERAQIDDPRVRKLADEIIEAQRREISEMMYLVDALSEDSRGGIRTRTMAHEPARLMSPSEALSTPDLATLDPTGMDTAEYSRVVSGDRFCSFAYTTEGKPIFVAGASTNGSSISGVLKIHGHLVRLTPENLGSFEDLVDGAAFAEGPIRTVVEPFAGEDAQTDDGAASWPANFYFALDAGMVVGYQGWYTCRR